MEISLNKKINLNRKQIFNKKSVNSLRPPIESSTQKATSQYIKYKYLRPNNNNFIKDKIIIKSANTNILINNPSSNITKINNILNKKNYKIPRNNFTKISKKPQIKSINLNNYIINTLNLSEKNYINNSTHTQKTIQRNLTEEINKSKKEREELKQIYKKHQRLIEKLIEDNKELNEKIGGIQNENNKLKKRINTYKENQEQLVMLVKLIQQNGVDIELIINKWNEDIEKEEEIEKKEKNEETNYKYLATDSLSEFNEKIDCSSFIPITVQEKKEEKKMKVSGVPKLNFDIIKNNYNSENKNSKKLYNHLKNNENFINKSK
jgi:hypothetical protein